MSVISENYDITQQMGGKQMDQDDLAHSSQRDKKRVDWTQVRKDKLRLQTLAEKRGVTLGMVYEELDNEYLNKTLLQGLVRKPNKRLKIF
jgi:hypothetical protein